MRRSRDCDLLCVAAWTQSLKTLHLTGVGVGVIMKIAIKNESRILKSVWFSVEFTDCLNIIYSHTVYWTRGMEVIWLLPFSPFVGFPFPIILIMTLSDPPPHTFFHPQLNILLCTVIPNHQIIPSPNIPCRQRSLPSWSVIGETWDKRGVVHALGRLEVVKTNSLYLGSRWAIDWCWRRWRLISWMPRLQNCRGIS